MYSALDKGREYWIVMADGSERALLYLGRDRPEDAPTIHEFLIADTGEIIPFLISQLEELEAAGHFRTGDLLGLPMNTGE